MSPRPLRLPCLAILLALSANAGAQPAPDSDDRGAAAEPVEPATRAPVAERGTSPIVQPCLSPAPSDNEGVLPAPPPPVPGTPEPEIGFTYSGRSAEHPDASAHDAFFDLGATFTDVRGGLGQRQALGAIALLGATGTFAKASGFTGHMRGSGYLGGGGAGLEGGLSGAFLLGQRLTLGRSDGPLARLGIAGTLTGNNRLYESRLSLPEGQLAYQIFTNDFFFEAGARGGLVLAGRFDPLEGSGRRLGGSFDVGPYASAWTSWLRLEFEGHRFVGREGEGDVNLARAGLCLPLGGMTACLDGRYTRGDVPRSDGSRARVEATSVGLVIGSHQDE